MKIEKVFAVIAAVCAISLAAPAQTVVPTPTQPPAPDGPQGPNGPQPLSTNAAPPPAEPAPTPLPDGRTVSYNRLVGPDPAVSNNVPIFEDVATDVNLPDVELPDAIRSMAVQAHLNIDFDPTLLTAADGHPLPVPHVTAKWKDLTAMQALQALLDNNGWQMNWNPRTKVARITRRDPAAKEPLIINVIPLSYGSPTNILREVEPTLSTGSSIVADMRTHQLIIRTTERELDGVTALIKKLDTPTREVLVEARIIQTSKDISSAKGVDWTGTLASQHVSFGNGLTQGTAINAGQTTTGAAVAGSSTVSPSGSPITSTSSTSLGNVSSNVTSFTSTILGQPSQGGGFSLNTARGISPATAFLNADGVQAVLSFLNSDSDTKTIAFPRTVALDGVPTELAVVQNIPVFIQTQSAPAGGSASGLATIQPRYDLAVQGTILNEVGVKLKVIPRIAGPTNVLLDLSPELSEQDGTVTETLNGQPNQAPIFQRSRITTQASVPSGYTLVLGGMDEDTVNRVQTKVPFFGDIPIFGNLFRSNNKNHTAQNTLIFVTPTIVTDSDYQRSYSDFLKRRPESPASFKTSSWDSAEPHDWTKPKPKVAPDYQP